MPDDNQLCQKIKKLVCTQGLLYGVMMFYPCFCPWMVTNIPHFTCASVAVQSVASVGEEAFFAEFTSATRRNQLLHLSGKVTSKIIAMAFSLQGRTLLPRSCEVLHQVMADSLCSSQVPSAPSESHSCLKACISDLCALCKLVSAGPLQSGRLCQLAAPAPRQTLASTPWRSTSQQHQAQRVAKRR